MQKAIFTFFFFIFSFQLMAQPTWKWGKRGGSQANNFNDATEFPYAMSADKNGNIYAIAKVYGQALHVDGIGVTGQGAKDILVTSFKCDGTYRWSMVIGGDQFDDVATAIRTDTMGGVYVCGNITMLPGTPGHFGDTMIDNTVKSVFLVKFDTNGVYKWLRMPQADTVDVSSQLSTAVDMDVTPDGHIRMLTSLAPGAYVNGAYIVNNTGMHMLHYDSDGIYQDAHEMDMNITGLSLSNVRMARDHNTGRYYVSGAGYLNTGSVFIGGVNVDPAMYAASFDQQGLHLWTLKGFFNNNQWSGFWGAPQIDDSGYVYFSGNTAEGDLFANSYIPLNSLVLSGQPIAMPFITKVDSNANIIWATHANTTEPIERPRATLRNNDEIVIAGAYSDKMEWEGFAGPHLGLNQLLQDNIFVTRINAHTGEAIQNDSLTSDGMSSEAVTAIAADGIGGVIIGGYYFSSLYVSTDTLTITNSNEPDLYLARFAENCDLPQSVQPASSTTQLSIYPNPATAQITITSNTPLQNIILTNTLGVTVAQRAVSGSDKVTIDISGLPTGIYFLKATNKNGQSHIEKILKQ